MSSDIASDKDICTTEEQLEGAHGINPKFKFDITSLPRSPDTL